MLTFTIFTYHSSYGLPPTSRKENSCSINFKDIAKNYVKAFPEHFKSMSPNIFICHISLIFKTYKQRQATKPKKI